MSVARLLLIAMLFGAPLACGGGSSSSDDGGIVGTGARSTGPVTATGSRVVNGTRWDVSSATIRSDDDSGFSETDLPLGRYVTIEGTRSADGLTGTATSVVFDPEIKGPIDTASIVDLGGGETGFTIFGIPVVADNGTFLEPASLVLMNGQVVEIDGLIGALGEIRATRIELEDNAVVFGSTEIEAKGVARNASASGFDLDLDLDGTPELSVLLDMAPCSPSTELDPPSLDLSTLPFVEVDGVLTAATTMCADRVEIEDDFDIDEDVEDFEIEGFVTSFTDLSNFVVGGVSVDASGASFEPTTLQTTIANGNRVEAEGRFSGGVLIAREVKSRDADARIDASIANVADIDVPGGSLRLLGIDVQTDATTDFDGFSSLSDLSAGDFLEVRGNVDSSGTVFADEVKRDSPDDVELRGPVEAINTASIPRRITILGVTFEADSPLTSFDGISADRFYSRVRPGDIVEAKDCFGPTTLLDQACEVDIED